jgi:MFS family permease
MGVTAHAPRTLGVYQVRDFFPGAREETIGPATGSLASAFNLAQLATSFAWGWAADVSGRPKALILLANVVCGAGSTAFALTTSYGGAMAARVVAGAFMTSGVVMKALIGTTLSKDAQAIAMAYRTLGAGLAQILTPIVIGQLANPCRRGFRVGGCGQGGFLATRPYALSGAFIAAVGVAATAVNFFMVPDVRTAHGVPVDGAPGGSGEGCGWPCCARRRTAAAAAAGDAAAALADDADAAPPAPAASAARPAPPPSAFSAAADPAAVPGPRGPPPLRLLSVPIRRASASSSASSARAAAFARSVSTGAAALDRGLSAWGRAGFAGGEGASSDLDAALAAATGIAEERRARRAASAPIDRPASSGKPSAAAAADGGEAGAAPPPPPRRRWWRDRRALTAIVAYAAITFLFDSLTDTVSLFASAPRTADVPGLALPVQLLTWAQAVSGVCIVAFSVLAYPPLQRAVGVARCATFGLAAGVPAALVPPLADLAVARGGPAAAVGVLAAGAVVYGAAFAATSTSSQIMVNLCAPDGDIGAVNGAGNTLSAGARVVGPLAVGALWAIAATDKWPDQWLPFGVLAGGFAVTLGLYVFSGLKDE